MARLSRSQFNARIFSNDDLLVGLGAKTATGGMIAVVSQFSRMALQLLSVAVLARLLAPEDFGIVVMATAITSFVALFSDLGLNAATVQNQELDQKLSSRLWTINVLVALVVMIFAWGLAPFANLLYNNSKVAPVILATAVALPLTALCAQHRALMMRRMLWVRLHGTDITATALGFIITALLAWKTDLGYWAIVIGNLSRAAVLNILCFAVFPWIPDRVTDFLGSGKAVRFGLNLTGFHFVNYFHRSLDNVLLGVFSGATAVGFYSRAYSLFMLPVTGLTAPIGTATIPALSRTVDDPPRWRTIYLTTLTGVTIIACPVAYVFFIFPFETVDLLYGEGWRPSAEVLKILAPVIVLQAIYSSIQWVYLSRGDTAGLLRASIPIAIMFAISFAIGSQYGMTGLASAYVIASAIATPIWIWLGCRKTIINPWHILGLVGVPILVAIGSAALSSHFFPESWPWIIKSIGFGFIYVSLIALVVGLHPRWRSQALNVPSMLKSGPQTQGKL